VVLKHLEFRDPLEILIKATDFLLRKSQLCVLPFQDICKLCEAPPRLEPSGQSLCSCDRGVVEHHCSVHFLTIALASSRMDGMERMLYRAPFTYGCILTGRKSSHLQVFKPYITQLSGFIPENTLANKESRCPCSPELRMHVFK
jgi:hypothetical protein